MREKRNVDNRERKRPPAALATQHLSHDTKPAESNKEIPREEKTSTHRIKTHPRAIRTLTGFFSGLANSRAGVKKEKKKSRRQIKLAIRAGGRAVTGPGLPQGVSAEARLELPDECC